MTIKDEQRKQAGLPKAPPASEAARPKAAGHDSGAAETTGRKPTERNGAAGQPAGQNAAGQKAAGQKTAAQKTAAQKTAGQKAAGPKAAGPKPAGAKAAGKSAAPATRMPAGREAAVAAEPGQVPRLPPPRTIKLAVLLMYAGAALTAIGLALSVIAVVTGEKALRASHPHATIAQLHATQHVLITVAVASGVIEIAAWLLLARANRGGLKWARIVSTVLFAFSTANLVGHLHGTATIGNTIYSIVIWLVGLATIVLLWLRESSAYFAA